MRYTIKHTKDFYDKTDELYKKFWDKEGRMHWGYFKDLNKDDAHEVFVEALHSWTELMLNKSNIDKDSVVLEIGCGDGNSSVLLSQKTGCQVIGIDISLTKIQNAQDKIKELALPVQFIQASGEKLPFPENYFTHIWSQACFYHINNKNKLLNEISRVLVKGGMVLFDDLVKKQEKVSYESKKYVINRLKCNDFITPETWIKILKDSSFEIIEVLDLSSHLKKSYDILQKLVLDENFDLKFAYDKTSSSIKQNEIGWYFLKAIKN